MVRPGLCKFLDWVPRDPYLSVEQQNNLLLELIFWKVDEQWNFISKVRWINQFRHNIYA